MSILVLFKMDRSKTKIHFHLTFPGTKKKIDTESIFFLLFDIRSWLRLPCLSSAFFFMLKQLTLSVAMTQKRNCRRQTILSWYSVFHKKCHFDKSDPASTFLPILIELTWMYAVWCRFEICCGVNGTHL